MIQTTKERYFDITGTTNEGEPVQNCTKSAYKMSHIQQLDNLQIVQTC